MTDEQPTWIALITPANGQATGNRLSQFSSGELRDCPICGSHVDKLWCWHGIEYVVLYVYPCEHRLGCWEDAPAWAREAGIVEDDDPHEDEPTLEELEADGVEIELLPAYYRALNEYQEQAGQKRLPGFEVTEDTDDPGKPFPGFG